MRCKGMSVNEGETYYLCSQEGDWERRWRGIGEGKQMLDFGLVGVHSGHRIGGGPALGRVCV
jgi:hypothetical protein